MDHDYASVTSGADAHPGGLSAAKFSEDWLL
jgi:hypothetical protein